MGLFDKLLSGQGDSAPFSKQEAFAGVLLAMAAADGDISDEEAENFKFIIDRKRTFRVQSVLEHEVMIERLFNILNKQGSDALLCRAAEALPEDLRPTVFAETADMVFADGDVDAGEQAGLERLQHILGLANDAALQIMEVMMIKNRE